MEIKNYSNKNVNKGINDKVEEISQKENKREFPIRRESRKKCLELKDSFQTEGAFSTKETDSRT